MFKRYGRYPQTSLSMRRGPGRELQALRFAGSAAVPARPHSPHGRHAVGVYPMLRAGMIVVAKGSFTDNVISGKIVLYVIRSQSLSPVSHIRALTSLMQLGSFALELQITRFCAGLAGKSVVGILVGVMLPSAFRTRAR